MVANPKNEGKNLQNHMDTDHDICRRNGSRKGAYVSQMGLHRGKIEPRGHIVRKPSMTMAVWLECVFRNLFVELTRAAILAIREFL